MKQFLKKLIVTCNMLEKYAYSHAGDIGKIMYTECGYKENDLPPQKGWREFEPGMRLYGKDRHYWLRLNFKTPLCRPEQRIVLKSATGFEGERDTLNPQSMVYIGGKLVQALDTNHTDVLLEPETDYDVYIYFYMGMQDAASEFKLWLSYCDEPARELYYDMSVPLEACRRVYNENSYEYAVTVRALEHAANMLELNYPYTPEYYERISAARKYLKKEYYEKLCGKSPVTVNCIGHTHIDVAWLWTLAQTKEKVQRSFSTVLELMRRYPEYRFMMSQPQLFKFLSEIDPDMYSEIKRLVKEGRWELEGAMWLEADCNLISGESMVRQILFGKRFLKEEFGIESEVLWLPDVFGYSAALPQIMNKSGIKHFVTSKISWNDTNTMPFDSFIWRGIDGSEIPTDFITTQDFERGGKFSNETTYVGVINPSMTAGAWNRYQQKEYSDEVMLVYGWGDGGGGPTADMLEQQRRLSFGLPGLPKTKISSLKEHLDKMRAKFSEACREIGRTPEWSGELYLEFHRGTYTSMAENKRYNRRAELMLQRTESILSIASLLADYEYRRDNVNDLWETVLLNQFHDIIPGSSIKEVYEDSRRQYAEFFGKCSKILEDGLSDIAVRVASDGGTLVYNSLGFERSGIINIGGKCCETESIPAFGWKVINPGDEECRVKISENTIENDYFILTIDKAGRITGLYDKRFDREVLSVGRAANEFRIYEDMPLEYENWELAEYYPSKCRILNEAAEITEISDGCRRGFKIKRRYRSSFITQYLYMYNNTQRIDVINEIDWAEQKQLVKIEFPFNIHTEKAVYDIQFGNVERNTHRNTSWDSARFEVCGHKWVDVSEYGYGVSLLNDCKYGFSSKSGSVQLTALKCGTYPNPKADQGKHVFSYSIYPHKGDFRGGATVREAYSFNQPLESVSVKANRKGSLPKNFSFVSSDSENVIIETLKQCEDGNGFILRMYDAYDCVSSPVLTFGMPVEKAEVCDLMENTLYSLPCENNKLQVSLKNYEILTLKLRIKK